MRLVKQPDVQRRFRSPISIGSLLVDEKPAFKFRRPPEPGSRGARGRAVPQAGQLQGAGTVSTPAKRNRLAVYWSMSGPVSNPVDLLGLLADDLKSASPNEGARDVAARALLAGFAEDETQLVVYRRQLLPMWQELVERAQRTENKLLSIEGWVTTKPWLALCVRVSEFGFIDADGKSARRLLFCLLVDVLSRTPESAKGRLGQIAAGLRVLIERLHKDPHASTCKPIESPMDLLAWVEEHPELAVYVKNAWRSSCKAFASALLEAQRPIHDGLLDDESEGDAPRLLASPAGLEVDLWQLGDESGQFEYEFPEMLRKTCLAKSLTRVIALSRLAQASPLVATSQEMKADVDRLLLEASSERSTPDERVRALAALLSMVTGTPMDRVPEIQWAKTDVLQGHWSRYPGALSQDARWLIRDEFNPRTSPESEFIPKKVHIPIPATLSALLLGQTDLHFKGNSVLGLDRVEVIRRQAVWNTTLFSRLARHAVHGISLAQHALGSSFGLGDAPIYYDRIRADLIAHEIAEVTFPWFSEAPRPPACGMPRHIVGSQKARTPKEVRQVMADLHAAFDSGAPLWQQVSVVSINLLHGYVFNCALRVNSHLPRITLRQISLAKEAAVVVDKEVAPDYRVRLVAIALQLVKGLRAYLALLEHVISVHPETELANQAAKALDGTGPLFLTARNSNDVRAVTEEDYADSLPPHWRKTLNWARHTVNDMLSEQRLAVHLRVAQMGWHGTREGAVSTLGTLSAVDALSRVCGAVANALRSIGWKPIETGHVLAKTNLAPVNWLGAEKHHREEFRSHVSRLEQWIEDRIDKLANASESRVNTFFEHLGMMIKVDAGRIVLKAPSQEPVAFPRERHEWLLRILGDGRNRGVRSVAALLLHRWLSDARKEGVITGPLPRRVLAAMPQKPGDFLVEAPVSLEHAETVWKKAQELFLSKQARTYLTGMLHGGIASSGTILACMDAGAAIEDLHGSNDVVLVAPPCDGFSHGGPTGTMAFSGRAALALRAWHRSGGDRRCDEIALRRELFDALGGEFHEGIGPDCILEELEALTRARNSLLSTGVRRQVSMARLKPAFADIGRVIALHENHLVFPHPAVDESNRPIDTVSVGRKNRGGGKATFDELKESLRSAESDANDERRSKLRNTIVRLGNGGVADSFADVLVLFVRGLLDGGGLRKERLALSTIRQRLYAVGQALVDAMPGTVKLQDTATWEMACLRAIHAASESGRLRLSQSLIYFHRILSREYANIPKVTFGSMFSILDQPAHEERTGFLTSSEVAAVLSISRLARSGEMRLSLRSSGEVPLKSARARRRVSLRGEHASEAMFEISRMLARKDSGDYQPRVRLFLCDEQFGETLQTEALTSELNRVIRIVTGNSNDDCYLFRKTAALALFSATSSRPSPSTWPLIDVLAEMGQADPSTLVGYYIHDPVALMIHPDDVTAKVPKAEAGWILGMTRVSAGRLLSKGAPSWLLPVRASRPSGGEAFCLPLPVLKANFNPTVAGAEQIATHIARGEMIEHAVAMARWPKTAIGSVSVAVQRLGHAGIALGEFSGAEGLIVVRPPRASGTRDRLRELRWNQTYWPVLHRAFEAWMRVAAIREVQGIPMGEQAWQDLLKAAPPLAALGWVRSRTGRLDSWHLEKEDGKQSDWLRLRWLLLCAWVAQEVRLSTS